MLFAAQTIIELNQYNFSQDISPYMIVNYYRPDCRLCKQFYQTYIQLQQKYQSQGLDFYQVNCAENNELCMQNKVKFFPFIEIFYNKILHRYISNDTSYDALTDYIDRTYIENNLVKSISYWEQYIKNKNIQSYILLDASIFTPKQLEPFTATNSEFMTQQHILLVNNFNNQIIAVRDGFKTQIDGNKTNFTSFQEFVDHNSLPLFYQLDEENYKIIRTQNQFYVVGSFSNGHCGYDETIKDFIINNQNQFKQFINDLQFASVDYEEHQYFLDSYLDGVDQYQISMGRQIFFLYINKYEPNHNYIYYKIDINIDKNNMVEEKMLSFLNYIYLTNRVGESDFIKQIKYRIDNNLPISSDNIDNNEDNDNKDNKDNDHNNIDIDNDNDIDNDIDNDNDINNDKDEQSKEMEYYNIPVQPEYEHVYDEDHKRIIQK